MDISPTPERPGSPWRTSTPWEALGSTESSCEYHGPFTAILWRAVEPKGWAERQSKRKNSLRLIGYNSFVKDFWGKCPKCDDNVHKEQMEAYDEAINGNELRKALRIQHAAIAGIDPKYAESDPFLMREFHPPMKQVLKAIRDYCTDFGIVNQQGRCMVLLGAPGVGKTHSMCAICNFVISKGMSARYVTINELAAEVKGSYSKDAEFTEAQIIESFVEPTILAIDEVGRMAATDHAKILFQAVLDRRYRKCKPTIIGSNLKKTEFEAVIGQAASDRLREGGGKTISMAWESLRGREDLIQ